MLREFILWDQRLSKGLFCENSEGLKYLKIIFSLSKTLFIFLLINIENV